MHVRTDVLILAVALLVFCESGVADDAPTLVAVASYVNQDQVVRTVGARVVAILNAKGIKSVGAGSFGMTVSVPSDKATEARELLAKAIKAEKLDLKLLEKKGDRYVVVTPDSVLEPK
jgi:hypothetical protein